MLEHPPVIEGRSTPLLQKQLTHSEACGWRVELGADHGILWVGRGPLPGSLGERFIVRTDGSPSSDRLWSACRAQLENHNLWNLHRTGRAARPRSPAPSWRPPALRSATGLGEHTRRQLEVSQPPPPPLLLRPAPTIPAPSICPSALTPLGEHLGPHHLSALAKVLEVRPALTPLLLDLPALVPAVLETLGVNLARPRVEAPSRALLRAIEAPSIDALCRALGLPWRAEHAELVRALRPAAGDAGHHWALARLLRAERRSAAGPSDETFDQRVLLLDAALVADVSELISAELLGSTVPCRVDAHTRHRVQSSLRVLSAQVGPHTAPWRHPGEILSALARAEPPPVARPRLPRALTVRLVPMNEAAAVRELAEQVGADPHSWSAHWAHGHALVCKSLATRRPLAVWLRGGGLPGSIEVYGWQDDSSTRSHIEVSEEVSEQTSAIYAATAAHNSGLSARQCAAVGTRPLPERGPFHHALPECFSALEQLFVPS